MELKSDLKKKYKDDLNTFLIICIPVCILAKMIEHLFLPEKYFFDSNRIVEMVNEAVPRSNWYKGSYKVAADFFKRINIFNFTEHMQWSLLLGILFSIITIIMFKRVKGIDFKQCVFGLMCIALLNIYIFNISKDAVQFSMFILIYIVLSIDKLHIIIKALATAALLYWMSTIYRNYYIIMAFFFIVIFIAFSIIRTVMRKQGKKLRSISYILIFVGLYAMVCVFMFSARSLYKKDYQDILDARNYSNAQGQVSAIKEPIEHNGNLNIFLLDYAINEVRMMFPVELVNNGIFYLPFFIFQTFMLFYTIRGIKRLDKLEDKTFIALCAFIAFYQGSVLFEPDFGSFVRHEAATFPVIILMVFNNQMWDNKDYESEDYLETTDF